MTTRSDKHDAHDLIQSLTQGRIYASCPNCQEPFALARAGLFFSSNFTSTARRVLARKNQEFDARSAELLGRPMLLTESSIRQASATNLGCILERIATTLPSFPLKSTECRSLFDPIDYVAFSGADSGVVDSIHFFEIKSGRSRLTLRQKEIRDVVLRGNVSLATYEPEPNS